MQLIDIYPDFGKSWNLIKIYRDNENNKFREEIKDFEDYFYCSEKKLEEFIKNSNIMKQITHYELCYTSAYNYSGKVYQIFLKGIWSKFKIMKELNKDFTNTFELDVPAEIRYTIDNISKIKKTNYRTLYFDIETSTDNGFPDWKNATENITCISMYDNYLKKYTTLVFKPYKMDIYEDKISEDKMVYYFDKEKDMIQYFIDYVIENDYDILTAWNISFDLTYIFGRCDMLGIDKTQLSPVGDVGVETRTNKQKREEIIVKIKQRFVVDLLLRYKGIIFKEIPSYSLDYVSTLELGEDEKKLKVSDFSDEWRMHLDRLIKYSIRDVEVLVNLDIKLNLIDYLEELRLIDNLPNIQYASIAKHLIDMAIFREYHNKLIMPSRGNLERQKIGGGYVKEPISNIYNNVAVYDFSGMYPSLIQTFNLSKDTVVELKDADFIIREDDVDEEKLERSHYVTGFSLKKLGIIPNILTNFLNVRRKIKKEMKLIDKKSIQYRDMNLRQYALKAPINANYGVNAYPGFRLYEPRVAATITYLGRQLTQYCGKRIEEDYSDVKVVYGDSVGYDSNITLENNKIEKIENLWKNNNSKVIKIKGKETKKCNFNILTCDNNKKNKYSKCKQIIRHKVKKKMYRVFLTNKTYLDVTEDHSLITFDDNMNLIESKPLDSDYILLNRKIPRKKIKSLNLPKKIINELDNYDIVPKRIHKIEEIEYNNYVYDLSVPETQRFYCNNILVHNTDSFFVSFKNENQELINEIKDKINLKYVVEFIEKYGNGKIKKNYINVEYEKYFKKVFLVKKRRYLGILKNGDWLYKGVDLVRSNIPEIILEILKEYIERLFRGDKIENILKDCYFKLKNTTDLDKFKIPLKISKEYKVNLPQKRAADWSNNYLKTKLKIGDKFYGLYVIDSNTDIIGFKEYDDLKNYKVKIDINKYIDMLYKKIVNLSREEDEISFNFSQKKITDFF
ncbi:MAG: DNA polymerase domain-containing protein [Promethearchaeia archaeon]